MNENRSSTLKHAAGRLVCGGLVLLPALAGAHPGHVHPGEDDEFDAFASGFVHPFTGVDHLLLVLAVGCYAFSKPGAGRAMMVPLFLLSLALGALTGAGNDAGLLLDIAIAATLFGAGALALAGNLRKPALVAAAVPVAGFVHGLAHAASAGIVAPAASFVAGMLMASGTLLLAAGMLWQAVRHRERPAALGGSILVGAGALILLQAI